MIIDTRQIVRALLWVTAVLGTGFLLAGPARADTVVTVKMPDCNGCTITAVSSVHPGWDGIDESRTLRRSATVRHSMARLHLPTARTRGLSFEIDAGRYNAGNAVAMAVIRYAGMQPGARVGPDESAAAGSGSFCWAGTSAHRARFTFASHRHVNREEPPASPGRYVIRVWSRTGRETLRDDLNMHSTFDGGLGVQQGPYCFDDQPTTVQRNPIPTGRTYLKTATPPGTEHLLLVVRSGDSIGYAFLPSAGTPGCFQGGYSGGQLVGSGVSLADLRWEQTSQSLQVRRRTWRLNGQSWKVIRGHRTPDATMRKALNVTYSRCAAVPAMAPTAPEPVVTPITPPPPTPPPSPTPPPPPPSATIVVNTCNTYNNCDIWNPIWVHANPAVSSHIADVGRGTALTARCWATGLTLTDGSNQTSEDDARQFTSSLWYGIDWNGGRGYVPAVWTTKREDHLGLPGC